MRQVVAAAPGTEPGRTSQLANVRYDLALLFIDTSRMDEARKELAETEEMLRAFEQASGRTETGFSKARGHIDELHRRLPN